MDGLGITFARSWVSKQSGSKKEALQQPLPPIRGTLLDRDPRPPSSTQFSSISGDSFMERRLSEFNEWKQKLAHELSIKTSSSPGRKNGSDTAVRQAKTKSPPSHSLDDKRPDAMREKARILALRARQCPQPDINAHPISRLQNISLRPKGHGAKTDELRCWRPVGDARDDQLRSCCEMRDVDSICEDCGFMLCPDCGSRCKGEDWCIVSGCVRCQTRLGVNICTPHLRELRARPTQYFHGHLVEPEALYWIAGL